MNLPNGVTNRLVLIRHGEPVELAKGRCYGKLDVGLSVVGKEQIEDSYDFLQDTKFSAIYSSPRKRSLESAKIIARKNRIYFDICKEFAEIDFGEFEGKTYEVLEKEYPETFQKWMQTPTEVKFPNGESFVEMQERVLKATKEILKKHANETIAIVSHGGVNRIILSHFLKIENADIFRIGQEYACVNVIDFLGDFPLIKTLNYSGSSLVI